MKIVIDNAIPFLEGVLEPYAEIRYLPGREIAARDVRDADALIVRTRTRCDAALLDGSRVRFIATATIGFDHIDLDYCRRRQIGVATAAGCNARGVLQWIAAVLHHLSQRDGWHPAEKTLGVVGAGHVGELVRRYAASWGFRVLTCDPPRAAREGGGDFVPLEEVARHCDLVTFHTPLDATTRRMADEALLRRLKPKAVVINSSRGEVVDGDALLRSGRPYVLDVWEHEPDIDRRLLASPHPTSQVIRRRARPTPRPWPSGPSPAVSRCRSKDGTPPSRRRIPARSAGTNWPRPSAHATTSPPRATRSNATPNDSRRCATATPTERSISEPVIGNRRLRRERPRPAGRRRRCGHPARNEDEGPARAAAAGKLSIVRCRL